MSTIPDDSSVELETYEENVGTLATLISGKNPPAAQVIHQLLDETRALRTKWLQELISIRDITAKYTCFKISKWVSDVT